MELSPGDVGGFIRLVDEVGGPGAIDKVVAPGEFRLVVDPDPADDQDPLSERYLERLELYRLISGRAVDQYANELTQFDLPAHLAAANPYALRQVSNMARHTATLSNAFVQAALPDAPVVLDMGCGWGLTSELLAYLGADVTAVDINVQFVRLVSERASRLRLPIRAVHESFDDFQVGGSFDMVLFYESLHHAIRPWSVLERVAPLLKPAGVIVLAAEPVQDIWWRNWGLRLDPLSVYCIAKFGWLQYIYARPARSRFALKSFRSGQPDLCRPSLLPRRAAHRDQLAPLVLGACVLRRSPRSAASTQTPASGAGRAEGGSLRQAVSRASINVLHAHNVVLAQVGTGLNLDHLQRDLARVFEAMGLALRDVGRLVLVEH